MGSVTADGEPWNGQPTSATVVLPPLGSLLLVPDTDGVTVVDADGDAGDPAAARPFVGRSSRSRWGWSF